MGFPFMQSIRNSNSKSSRPGMLSAHTQGHRVNVNQVRIPELGCLEEGKDEDGQSGVGSDDLELGMASDRTIPKD